jgi:hypothetical protein
MSFKKSNDVFKNSLHGVCIIFEVIAQVNVHIYFAILWPGMDRQVALTEAYHSSEAGRAEVMTYPTQLLELVLLYGPRNKSHKGFIDFQFVIKAAMDGSDEVLARFISIHWV